MGIEGFLGYFDKREGHPSQTSLQKLVTAARQRLRTTATSSSSSNSVSGSSSGDRVYDEKHPLTMLIDANAVLRFIAQNKPEDFDKTSKEHALLAVLTSDYHIIRDRWSAFIRVLQDAGCRCIFYFETSSGDDRERSKLQDRHNKQSEFAEQSARCTGWLSGGAGGAKRNQWINALKELPQLVEMFMESACRSLGCEVKICVGEADFELIADARRGGANTYILSRDTDFLITSGIQYLPFHSLERDDKSNFSCRVYTSHNTAGILGIPESRLAEFAFLAGNDYSEHLVWSDASPEFKSNKWKRIDYAINKVRACYHHGSVGGEQKKTPNKCIEAQYPKWFTNVEWVRALATTRQLYQLPSSSASSLSSATSTSLDAKGELLEDARAMSAIHTRLRTSELPITTLAMTQLATVIEVTTFGDAVSFPDQRSSPSLLWHPQVVLPVERALMLLSGRSSCRVLRTNLTRRAAGGFELSRIEDIVTTKGAAMWHDRLLHALNVVTKPQQQQQNNSGNATDNDGLIEAKTIITSASLSSSAAPLCTVEERTWFVDHDQQIAAKNIPLVYTPLMDRDTKVALWSSALHSYPALLPLSSSASSVEIKDVAATSPPILGLSLVTSIDDPRLLSLRVPIICWRTILAAHIEQHRLLPEYLVDVFLFTSALLSVCPPPTRQQQRLPSVSLLPADIWLPPAAGVGPSDKVSDTIMMNFFTVLTQISYAYQMSHDLAGMLDMNPRAVAVSSPSSPSSSSSSAAGGASDVLPFVGAEQLFAPNRTWTLLHYLLTNRLSLVTLATPLASRAPIGSAAADNDEKKTSSALLPAVIVTNLATKLGVSVTQIIATHAIFIAAKQAILQPFGTAAPAWTMRVTREDHSEPAPTAAVTASTTTDITSVGRPIRRHGNSTSSSSAAARSPPSKVAVASRGLHHPPSHSNNNRRQSSLSTSSLSYAAALSGHSPNARTTSSAGDIARSSSNTRLTTGGPTVDHGVTPRSPRCRARAQCPSQERCKYYHTVEEKATWERDRGRYFGGENGDDDYGSSSSYDVYSHNTMAAAGVTIGTPPTDTATAATAAIANLSTMTDTTTHQAASSQREHDSITPSPSSSSSSSSGSTVKKKLRARALEFIPHFEIASIKSDPLPSPSAATLTFDSTATAVVAPVWPVAGRVVSTIRTTERLSSSSSLSSERFGSEQTGTIKAVTWESEGKQWHVSVTWDGNDTSVVCGSSTLKLIAYPDVTPPLAASGSSSRGNSNGHDNTGGATE